MSEEDRIVHVEVYGRVQGVGFRAWLARQAVAHGLAGWARNRRNGSVEAVLAGPSAAVAAMIRDLNQGPPMARVARLDERPADLEELAARHGGEPFSLLPTV